MENSELEEFAMNLYPDNNNIDGDQTGDGEILEDEDDDGPGGGGTMQGEKGKEKERDEDEG